MFSYFLRAIFSNLEGQKWRLDSNIESKSSGNTYLNIIKILFLL